MNALPYIGKGNLPKGVNQRPLVGDIFLYYVGWPSVIRVLIKERGRQESQRQEM